MSDKIINRPKYIERSFFCIELISLYGPIIKRYGPHWDISVLLYPYRSYSDRRCHFRINSEEDPVDKVEVPDSNHNYNAVILSSASEAQAEFFT